MHTRNSQRLLRDDLGHPLPQPQGGEPAREIRTVVIGHKNPDTDCIAAAAGYAELKRRLGLPRVSAACAGLPSARTEFLFKRFQVPLPAVLSDVFPRVRDVLDPNPPIVRAGQTLLQALALLQRTRRRRLPVVDAQGGYLGMLSLFDLADRMVQKDWETDHEGAGDGLVGREVQASLTHMAEVLQAKPLAWRDETNIETFEVYVGAMRAATLASRMSTRDRRHVALVVGDREEVHRLAVALKLRLLILTGNSPMEEDLVREAGAAGVSILRTPFDSATTIRRIKFSAPSELRIQPDAAVLQAGEKLSDLQALFASEREEAFAVVDGQGKLEGVLWKFDLEREPPLQLILVDHNEIAQAVEGAQEVPIVEIIDHHRVDPPATPRPIVFLNDVIGATCTLVAEQFRRFGQAPPPALAGVLMGGIITDTLLLRSPTSTPRDEAALRWLQELSGADPARLAEEIFQVGSCIATLSPRQVLTADKKDYRGTRGAFAVAQVEEVGYENFHRQRAALLLEMEALRKEEQLALFGLLVTNVVRESSLLLCVGEKRLLDRLGYNRLDEQTFDLPGIVSRKKQLLPQLLNLME